MLFDHLVLLYHFQYLSAISLSAKVVTFQQKRLSQKISYQETSNGMQKVSVLREGQVTVSRKARQYAFMKTAPVKHSIPWKPLGELITEE